MARPINQRPKRSPSDHEKRIRFLTGLSLFVIVLATIGLFLLINLQQLFPHSH
jgi:hypothetical protein